MTAQDLAEKKPAFVILTDATVRWISKVHPPPEGARFSEEVWENVIIPYRLAVVRKFAEEYGWGREHRLYDDWVDVPEETHSTVAAGHGKSLLVVTKEPVLEEDFCNLLLEWHWMLSWQNFDVVKNAMETVKDTHRKMAKKAVRNFLRELDIKSLTWGLIRPPHREELEE